MTRDYISCALILLGIPDGSRGCLCCTFSITTKSTLGVIHITNTTFVRLPTPTLAKGNFLLLPCSGWKFRFIIFNWFIHYNLKQIILGVKQLLVYLICSVSFLKS